MSLPMESDTLFQVVCVVLSRSARRMTFAERPRSATCGRTRRRVRSRSWRSTPKRIGWCARCASGCFAKPEVADGRAVRWGTP
jgi:hypothetical protein